MAKKTEKIQPVATQQPEQVVTFTDAQGSANVQLGKYNYTVKVECKSPEKVEVTLFNDGSVKVKFPADVGKKNSKVSVVDSNGNEVENVIVKEDILEVRNLKKYFPLSKTLLGKTLTSLRL